MFDKTKFPTNCIYYYEQDHPISLLPQLRCHRLPRARHQLFCSLSTFAHHRLLSLPPQCLQNYPHCRNQAMLYLRHIDPAGLSASGAAQLVFQSQGLSQQLLDQRTPLCISPHLCHPARPAPLCHSRLPETKAEIKHLTIS